MRIQHWLQAVARQVEECPLPCSWVRCSVITATLAILGMVFVIAVAAGSHYARLHDINDDSVLAAAAVYNRHVDPPLGYTEANPSECTSNVCRWNANYLFYRISMRGDPCDDFYEHVCSAFQNTTRTHQLPYPQLSVRQLFLDFDLFMSRYSKIKKRRRLSSERNFLGQAMWFHEKCKAAHVNNSDGDQQSDWAQILGTLQLSAWPYLTFQGDIVSVVSAGDRYLMLQSLFRLGVLRSNRNDSKHDVVLKEPVTYLKRYASWPRKNVLQRYEDIIFGAISLYSNPFTGALVSRQISKFEMMLQKLTYLDSVPAELLVKGVSTVAMFPKSDWWDWLKYMTLLFDSERSAMRSTIAIVEDPVYFHQFTSIYNFEDYRTAIANYVGFKAMVTLAPLLPPGYALLYELGFGYDIPKVEPQLRACTLLLEKMYRYGIGIAAKLTLSREFANVHRRHRDVQLVELFNSTRLVFGQMLGSGQSWFSATDLEQALRKLNAMAIAFGTQENFLQYEKYRQTPPLPLESNDTLLGTAFTMFSYASRTYWSAWSSRGTTGKAYDNAYDASVFDWESEYQPSNNLVFLPNSIVAFLTAVSNKIPFQLYPVILAHVVRGVLKALLRSNSAFDDEGRALRSSWWSAASVGAIENVTKCLQRQYQAAAAAESGGGRRSAGKWTVARMEEAFLDNALLVPLYELYERALSNHNATDMFYQLSYSRISGRELFFYNYAVTFCDGGDNESRRAQHSMATTPSKWRVNVPLRNFPPFRKTFSCENWKQPNLYCNVWKGFG